MYFIECKYNRHLIIKQCVSVSNIKSYRKFEISDVHSRGLRKRILDGERLELIQLFKDCQSGGGDNFWVWSTNKTAFCTQTATTIDVDQVSLALVWPSSLDRSTFVVLHAKQHCLLPPLKSSVFTTLRVRRVHCPIYWAETVHSALFLFVRCQCVPLMHFTAACRLRSNICIHCQSIAILCIGHWWWWWAIISVICMHNIQFITNCKKKKYEMWNI